jgi:hypothetical protein
MLQTGDVLLDIETPTSLNESDHPDLVAAIGKLKNRRNVAVAFSGALVVNRYGQLISHGRSPLEMDRELGESQQLAYDRQPWQDLRNKRQPGAEGNNSFPFGGAGGTEQGNETKKGGRRRKNPIRRNNAYGGGMDGMDGMGGMGGGMPGMGGIPGMDGGMPGMGGIPGMDGGMGGGFSGSGGGYPRSRR